MRYSERLSLARQVSGCLGIQTLGLISGFRSPAGPGSIGLILLINKVLEWVVAEVHTSPEGPSTAQGSIRAWGEPRPSTRVPPPIYIYRSIYVYIYIYIHIYIYICLFTYLIIYLFTYSFTYITFCHPSDFDDGLKHRMGSKYVVPALILRTGLWGTLGYSYKEP